MDLNSNLLRPCLDLLEAKFISSLSIWMQKEGGGCDTRYYQCELGFLTVALWDFTHHNHSLEKTRNRMASSIPRREQMGGRKLSWVSSSKDQEKIMRNLNERFGDQRLVIRRVASFVKGLR